MKLLHHCLLLYCASTCLCLAQTVTFDDLPSTPFAQPHDPMPAGYAGLSWDNFRVLNASDSMASGYRNGVISAKNVIYNMNGNPAQFTHSTPFNFVSAYIAAAWNDGLQVEVQGFIGTSLAYDSFYTVNTSGPSFLTFNYLGVNRVNFISSGGTHHNGYLGTGTSIALDNLVIDLASAPLSPNITKLDVTASHVVLRGNNGPGNGSFYVLSTTNLAFPLTQWARVATNQFDAGGHFQVTNVLDGSAPQQFFRLQLP